MLRPSQDVGRTCDDRVRDRCAGSDRRPLVLAPPAGAGPKGKAGNRDQGKGVMATRGGGQISLGVGTSRLNIGRNESAGDAVVRIIDDALGITNGGLGLPPGLAKRAQLPPGLSK